MRGEDEGEDVAHPVALTCFFASSSLRCIRSSGLEETVAGVGAGAGSGVGVGDMTGRGEAMYPNYRAACRRSGGCFVGLVWVRVLERRSSCLQGCG